MYEGEGMRLEGVSPGGAAEKGGLKDGDVIVDIGGKPVKNVTGYMTAMSGQKAGNAVEVTVLRKEKRVTLKVTPE
jgi:S1-C subfamily serine protease